MPSAPPKNRDMNWLSIVNSHQPGREQEKDTIYKVGKDPKLYKKKLPRNTYV